MKEHKYEPEQLRELLSCTLEEPEVVSMKMKETYEVIRADEGGKKRKGSGRYKKAAAVAAAAAAVAVAVVTPVMAKGIGEAWDAVTAAIFGADEKVQESYESTGLSQTFDVPQEKENADAAEPADEQTLPTATVDGMKVTLKQVLTDGYMLYLNVDVEAPEGITIDDSCIFDRTDLLVDGKSYDPKCTMAMNSGFANDEYAVSESHRAYEVVFNVDGGIHLDGKHVTLLLKDFQVDKGKLDMETKIAGEWRLAWDMSAQYHGKTLNIDLEGGMCGAHAALKSIEITPLSYTLRYDYNGTDMELFDDILWVEFVTKDGEILNEYNNQDSLITGNGGVSNIEYSRESFTKILDVNELAGVRIDGVTYPVK